MFVDSENILSDWEACHAVRIMRNASQKLEGNLRCIIQYLAPTRTDALFPVVKDFHHGAPKVQTLVSQIRTVSDQENLVHEHALAEMLERLGGGHNW